MYKTFLVVYILTIIILLLAILKQVCSGGFTSYTDPSLKSDPSVPQQARAVIYLTIFIVVFAPRMDFGHCRA